MVNWCTMLTLRKVKFPMRWLWAIVGEFHRIHFLPERQLCQSCVYPKWVNQPILVSDQHAWRLHARIGIIQNDIDCAPKQCIWTLLVLIPCPQKVAKHSDNIWHHMVGTVLSQLRYRDIAGPGLKWHCAEGFYKQCSPQLAPWVGD